jgi:1-acyl-sn-glycerol-3-phosphate acyltransferase
MTDRDGQRRSGPPKKKAVGAAISPSSAGALKAPTSTGSTRAPSSAGATKASSSGGVKAGKTSRGTSAAPSGNGGNRSSTGSVPAAKKPSRKSARASSRPVAAARPVAEAVVEEVVVRPSPKRRVSARVSVTPVPPPEAPSDAEFDLDDAAMTDAFGDAPAFLEGNVARTDKEKRRISSSPPPPAVEVALEATPTLMPPPPSPAQVSKPKRAAETSEPRSNYAVEETIDKLLTDARSLGEDPAARKRVADAFAEIADKLGGDAPTPAPGLLGDLFGSQHAAREWGPQALRDRGSEVDPFGLDRAYEARYRPLFEAMYKRWFRVTTRDVVHVPHEGRAMLVGNHAGTLPWDGLMLKTAVGLEHPAQREVRWLVEDSVFHAPFLGAVTNRLGAVRACPENAERLLESDTLLAVFPEGDKGATKPFTRRYELQRFGRGGYVRLALRTRTPIVPVAIVGAEEAHPTLFSMGRAAKLFGVPFFPVTATFPWLGPLGLVPLPSRWVIIFGEPIDLRDRAPGTEDDPIAVQRISDDVRNAVQSLLTQALSMRTSTF